MKYFDYTFIFFTFFTIGIISVSCSESIADQKAYSHLRQVVDSVNKTCPKQINDILKLENMTVIKPSTLQANFIVESNAVSFNEPDFQKILKQSALEVINNDPDAIILKSMHTTFKFNYLDTARKFLYRFYIRPDDYLTGKS